MSPHDAIYKAALLRFRPILMTTLAACLVRCADAVTDRREMRQPLGLVMVGGLILSQVLTLFTTPALPLLRPSRPLLVLGAVPRSEGRDGMNLSAPFIARPVATTLLSLSVVLLAPSATRFSRVAAAAGRLSGDLGSASLPAQSRNHGVVGGDTARARARHHCRRERDRSQSSQGSTRINIQFDLGRTSTRPRVKYRRRSTRPGRCRDALPGMPSYRKINPSQARSCCWR